MMKKRTYAKEVTKTYLQRLGVEHVSTDGQTIIVKGRTRNPHTFKSGKRTYKGIHLYDPEVRANTPKEERNNHVGQFRISVHVLNYVWNSGKDKPAGMVIDHIDNDPLNNDISNLQCITPKENINKERRENTKMMPCKLNKPRSYYENKLAEYEQAYEQAKKEHDAQTSHKLRAYISQYRARLRYWDAHADEASKLLAEITQEEKTKATYHEKAEKKKELKRDIDTARRFYKEALAAYGKDDSYTYECKCRWRMAIIKYYAFCSEAKYYSFNSESKSVA